MLWAADPGGISMFVMLAAAALAAGPAETPKGTDFAMRVVPGAVPRDMAPATTTRPLGTGAKTDLSTAARIGANWGRVTSTWRTASRNRAVGGVRNSFHLVGRAIDIARRAGVRHADVEAAYRRAGFTLVESLDEGDHSHFAFGTARSRLLAAPVSTADKSSGETRWRIVSAPTTASR